MEVRIDKWLWCVRVFKTRNLATEECRAGKVKINGHETKASHIVKIGEVIEVQIEQLKRILFVKDILDRRVSAKIAVDFVEDQTPSEEIERLRLARKTNFEKRDRGVGRPTKRERRDIEKFKYD
ncbi:MAG: RNA-binding S4 domain-containing protein [Bacteroidetes bacterium]|nr:RNA-binding S4 domain-containing protein [Bacteroidota bacterium]